MPSCRLVGTARFNSSFGLRSWRALGLGVLMMVMSSVAYGNTGVNADDRALGVDVSLEPTQNVPQIHDESQECWVFLHMLKSGGQTTKGETVVGTFTCVKCMKGRSV